MATWTAHRQVAGCPDEVLALLTEPDAIARWSPIEFELLEAEAQRLSAGDTVRVRGILGGRALEFQVDVAAADDGYLALSATGPVRLDVEYVATATGPGSDVSASVAVSGRGLLGRLLSQATNALLAAGALNAAVSRIASELEPGSVGYGCEPALAA